jgi:hypothetical protein
LYIADLYRGVLQHSGFLTHYLVANIEARQLLAPLDGGRIWRVVREGAERRKPVTVPVGARERAALLGHALTESTISLAAAAVRSICDPAEDLRGDRAYKTAMAAGALGGKITGAGGGGYMLFYAPFERRFEVAEELRKAKFEVLDISLDEMGMESWTDG